MLDLEKVNLRELAEALEENSYETFSPATVRAYAFDVLNFLRFCATRGLTLSAAQPADLFDYLDWRRDRSRPASRWCG